MKSRLLVASVLTALAGCTYPAVEPPGEDHPANVQADVGLLPEFALEDDSPLRGEPGVSTPDEPVGRHQHHRH